MSCFIQALMIQMQTFLCDGNSYLLPSFITTKVVIDLEDLLRPELHVLYQCQAHLSAGHIVISFFIKLGLARELNFSPSPM